MDFIPSFAGKVENGKVELLHPDIYQRYVDKLEGKPIQLTVEKFREHRSLAQNKRHFGLLVRAISDYTGDDIARVHRLLRSMFLSRLEPDFKGDMIETVRSSTELTKDEFTEFMKSVEIFAGELGIEIQDKV